MTASDDDDELSARTGKQARGKKSKYPPNITVSMIAHANKNKGKNAAAPVKTPKPQKRKRQSKSGSDGEGEGDDDDEAPGSSKKLEGSDRGTRMFSPIGFLMTSCNAGLDAPTSSSDKIKRDNIKFIDQHYGIPCKSGGARWKNLDEKERTIFLRFINKTWSKAFNSWRHIIRKGVRALLCDKRDDQKFPVEAYFQVSI